MRFVTLLILIVCFSFNLFAQKPDDVLATANGRSFTAQDLSPNIARVWLKLHETLANARKSLLDKQIENTLLELEATNQKTTVKKLLQKEVAKKVKNPSEKQIKTVYDANRSDIGTAKLSEVRAQIIAYLRQEPERKAYINLITSLKTKHLIIPGKDIRIKSNNPYEVAATVGVKQIRIKDFISKNGLVLYEYEANVFDQFLASIRQAVDSYLYSSEAKELQLVTSDYIAQEITNKMRNDSNEESDRLSTALRNRLYKKYRVKFFVKEPKPFVQRISTDDDPSLGEINAPITVVMFTDLQCPACSAVYPVLKNVLAEYDKKIRFVVRDFPLMELHKNAFNAALAANAANAQGKYFEYKELLYKNQNSLDTESLKKFAAQIGLNQKRFEADMKNKKFADEIRKDMQDGKSYGISGTPTIFVNGIKVRILSAEHIRKAIDRFVK